MAASTMSHHPRGPAFPPHPGYTPRGYGGRPGMRSSASAASLASMAAAQSTSGGQNPALPDDFDGKRPRKSVMRKTVDYNSSFMGMLERRIWQRDFRDKRAIQPDVLYYPHITAPVDCAENPANAVTTKFVKTATNKMRCPIFTLGWTPEGRRLITGASSGEFTLWNGLTFNFETILQAHDSPVRAMQWSHNDTWMVTGDHGGYIKYWQSNMNNVKMFQAHKEPVRCVSFSPTDAKFASCSDDGTVRVWDFFTCAEERVLRGHGADVKCVDWHPTKGLLASGSKDNQQPIKLWEPKTGNVLMTLYSHKSTVMDVKWNANGNWLLTASRDHLIKIFDIRKTKEELQTFRGHKKEASTVAWHPVHEGVFASGGSDGSIMFWSVGADKEVGTIELAHESIVWSLAWHPAGHILASGSNDHNCKFWTRNRPGDNMRDKYNLNTLPSSHGQGAADADAVEMSDSFGANLIPGMAPEDRVEAGPVPQMDYSHVPPPSSSVPSIAPSGPSRLNPDSDGPEAKKKTPFAKPIPQNFQNSWNDLGMGQPGPNLAKEPGCMSLADLQSQATAVVAFGNVYPVLPGSSLFMSIMAGEAAVKDVLRNEFIL